MGLRERKAEHTRAWIADAALELFEQRGYEATTLEDVAARAEVSASTLHRYFPTKDSLLVDHPMMEIGTLSRAFRERPASEPVAEALGAALLAFLDAADTASADVARVRAQIDRVPVARARMWDSTHRETALLVAALCERDTVQDDEAALAAEIALTVVVLALQPVAGAPVGARARAERIMAMFADPAVVDRVVPRC